MASHDGLTGVTEVKGSSWKVVGPEMGRGIGCDDIPTPYLYVRSHLG